MTGRPNFLPPYRPRVYAHDGSKLLKCQCRNKDLVANSEEVVRQRVLHWLIHTKKWPKNLISLEEPINFIDATRGRADILLKNEHDEAVLVIECKHKDFVIGMPAIDQAKRYAQKLRAKNIWVTNGDEHIFLTKRLKNKRLIWETVRRCPVINEEAASFKSTIAFPRSTKLEDLKRYWPNYEDGDFGDLYLKKYSDLSNLSLSINKIIYSMKTKLPYSYRGLHILEDRDINRLNISTPSGSWAGDYRTFLVATEGRVETACLGLQRWEPDRSVRLCVAFIKPHRRHHALQLNSKYCVKSSKGFEIYHNGAMGGNSVTKEEVLEGVWEACRDDLIVNSAKHLEKNRRLHLGSLPYYKSLDWENTKVLLSNLFHYSIIRTNLREVHYHARR